MLLLLLLQNHVDDYAENKLTASKHRILITKGVGQVWEDMSATQSATVVGSIKKCGISVAYDGSQVSIINIENVPDYTIGTDD